MADTPDTGGGLLGFFGRGYDPAAAYGGLLADPATKDAMQARALAAMANAFAEGGMPVPYKGGIPLLSTIGRAGAAAYGGQDALIKARLEQAQAALAGTQGDVARQNLDFMKAYVKSRQQALGGGDAKPGGPLSLLQGAGGTAAPGDAGGPAISTEAVSTDLPNEARAFLDTVAGPESKGAYNIRYTPQGGATFDSFADHPRIYEPGPDGKSSAAGRYQIVASTFDPLAQKYGYKDFSPQTQDHAAWQLAQDTFKDKTRGDLLTALRAGKLDEVQKALHGQWKTLDLGSFGANLDKYTQAGAATVAALPGGPTAGLLAQVPNVAERMAAPDNPAPPRGGLLATAPPGPPAAVAAGGPPAPPTGAGAMRSAETAIPGAYYDKAQGLRVPGMPDYDPTRAPTPVTPVPSIRGGTNGIVPPGVPGPQGGLLDPPPGLGPPGATPVSTGAAAPPAAAPLMPGRLGLIHNSIAGLLDPRAAGAAPGGPPIIPAAAAGGDPGANLVSGLRPPGAGPTGGLLAASPPAEAAPPPPGAPAAPIAAPAAPIGAAPAAPYGGAPMPAIPPPPRALPPPPIAAIPGAPTQADIAKAQYEAALLTALGKPIPPDTAKILGYTTDVALAQAQAAAKARAEQPYTQGNAAYEAQVKASYQAWVEQNKPRELRPGTMDFNPATGQYQWNPRQIEVTDKQGNKYFYNEYPSPTPGGVPRLEPIAQSALGPGAVQTLTQTAAAQPIAVGNDIAQKGPGYTQPIQTRDGSVIPPAADATPISGPKDYLADRAKDYAKTESEWGNSVAPANKAIQRMNAIMTTMKSYQTGAWAEETSEIVASLKAVGITLPPGAVNNPALAQEILKNNFGAALDAMKSTGLSRWTQAELFGQTKNLANPNLQPDANLAIGSQVIGTLQWEQQMLKDYREAKKYSPMLDPQDFQARWTDANNVQDYIDRAAAKIGPLKGGTAKAPELPEGSMPTGRTYGGKPSYFVPDGKGGRTEKVLH